MIWSAEVGQGKPESVTEVPVSTPFQVVPTLNPVSASCPGSGRVALHRKLPLHLHIGEIPIRGR